MPPIQLDHIAIALPRIADAPAALVDILGGAPDQSRPATVFRWASWRFEGGGVIEILEPTGPDGFLHRFLAARGPGVHHVTFKVPDLASVCRRAEAHGYDIVGRDESDPSWKEAFLHPKQAQGIVVQLAESASSAPLEAAEPIPPGRPDPPPPARILGLRLRALTAERAITQWRDVLGGQMTETPTGGLSFRWSASPLRLTVDVDPAAPEGPIAIEVEPGRAAAALAAAGARLGIRLQGDA